jgi:hypothetical protein
MLWVIGRRTRRTSYYAPYGSGPLVGLARLGPGYGTSRRGYRRGPRAGLRITVVVLVLVLVAGSAVAVSRMDWFRLEVAGVADGDTLRGSEARQLEVLVDAGGLAAGDVRVSLNGNELAASNDGDRVVAPAGDAVRDGENLLQVHVDSRVPFTDGRTVERRFTADLAGAQLWVPEQVRVPKPGTNLVLRGLVDDAVSVEVEGVEATLDGGAFTVELPGSQIRTITVRATHENGSIEEAEVEVTGITRQSTYPPTRAVHIAAADWRDPAKRDAVLRLAREGRINAVQLDIKDEAGLIGYASKVPLAVQSGAVDPQYDAREAIDELHGLGVRVIGRVVCFLDPILARWAWRNDQQAMVVQMAEGGPLRSGYGEYAFTNLAHPEVQDYLIQLSVEAAELGFDEILYDYIRRPEGKFDTLRFPGLDVPPDVAVARFVRDTREALRPTETEFGISVFGIAATRPAPVAQDMRLLAPHVDYISPMVYPSHWGRGEYGVDDPNRQPADIVARSLLDFHLLAAGSGAAIVPWLQDFDSKGVPYGDPEVRAQIDAALGTGSAGFLLWNALSVYHGGALDPVFG